MKITKLGHSCLLVEMPAPVNRTVLFDPGELSEVDVASLQYLDDIVITHEHFDHCDADLITQLAKKFPAVRIKTTMAVADKLSENGVQTVDEDVEGVVLFDSPHEGHEPFLAPPEQIGVHYLDKLTHPGDSHSFKETKDILALPVTAPWGSTDTAVKLALQLKPKYILPIHDWHWKDAVRAKMYTRLEALFREYDITFLNLSNGKPVVLDI